MDFKLFVEEIDHHSNHSLELFTRHTIRTVVNLHSKIKHIITGFTAHSSAVGVTGNDFEYFFCLELFDTMS